MAHFLLTPVGSSGDVHPYIGLGRALKARGHDVTIVTAAPFRTASESAGLRFVATQSDEEFDRVTRDPRLWDTRYGPVLVLQMVATFMREGYQRIEEAYEPGRTVLVGHSLAFSTRVLEEKHGAPAATIHLAPSIFRTSHQMPVVAAGVDLSFLPTWIKDVLWRVIDRQMFDRHIVPELNRWRAELGLPPVSRIFKDWLHSPRKVIGLFPEWFAPIQPDWPRQLVLTGFPLYDEPDDHPMSDDLARFLESGPPPVLFTPGSANRAATAFFTAAADAVRRLGCRALFLTKYPEQVPANSRLDIRHEPYVPFSLVFPKCSAIVHHGGIGTCAQGLAAGVPQLVMPIGFDQPDNAARLERLGVGRWLVPRQFTGDRVARMLDTLVSESARPEGRAYGTSRVAERTRHWAAAMREKRPVEATCAALESLIP